MDAKRPAFRPKIDIFMPLYIGKYLQDTQDLDATESGAYLHLLMHEWLTGPLPNDQKRLARIAKLSPDAWSIANATVMHFFKLGPDGRWRQGFLERLKEEWTGKRVKAHEKAVKAAQARWGKRKAKTGPKTDAPSIPQAMQEECPITLSTTNPLGDSLRSSPLPPVGISGPDPGAAAAPEPTSQSEAKAKSPVKALGEPEATRQDTHPHLKVSASATGKPDTKNPPQSNGSHLSKAPARSDQRYTPFKNEVSRWWIGLNGPAHPCPWLKSDKRALRDLLESAPSINLEELKALLHNRADSEVQFLAPPRKWLADLLEFRDGPLDRFKHLRRSGRIL